MQAAADGGRCVQPGRTICPLTCLSVAAARLEGKEHVAIHVFCAARGSSVTISLSERDRGGGCQDSECGITDVGFFRVPALITALHTELHVLSALQIELRAFVATGSRLLQVSGSISYNYDDRRWSAFEMRQSAGQEATTSILLAEFPHEHRIESMLSGRGTPPCSLIVGALSGAFFVIQMDGAPPHSSSATSKKKAAAAGSLNPPPLPLRRCLSQHSVVSLFASVHAVSYGNRSPDDESLPAVVLALGGTYFGRLQAWCTASGSCLSLDWPTLHRGIVCRIRVDEHATHETLGLGEVILERRVVTSSDDRTAVVSALTAHFFDRTLRTATLVPLVRTAAHPRRIWDAMFVRSDLFVSDLLGSPQSEFSIDGQHGRERHHVFVTACEDGRVRLFRHPRGVACPSPEATAAVVPALVAIAVTESHVGCLTLGAPPDVQVGRGDAACRLQAVVVGTGNALLSRPFLALPATTCSMTQRSNDDESGGVVASQRTHRAGGIAVRGVHCVPLRHAGAHPMVLAALSDGSVVARSGSVAEGPRLPDADEAPPGGGFSFQKTMAFGLLPAELPTVLSAVVLPDSTASLGVSVTERVLVVMGGTLGSVRMGCVESSGAADGSLRWWPAVTELPQSGRLSSSSPTTTTERLDGAGQARGGRGRITSVAMIWLPPLPCDDALGKEEKQPPTRQEGMQPHHHHAVALLAVSDARRGLSLHVLSVTNDTTIHVRGSTVIPPVTTGSATAPPLAQLKLIALANRSSALLLSCEAHRTAAAAVRLVAVTGLIGLDPSRVPTSSPLPACHLDVEMVSIRGGGASSSLSSSPLASRMVIDAAFLTVGLPISGGYDARLWCASDEGELACSNIFFLTGDRGEPCDKNKRGGVRTLTTDERQPRFAPSARAAVSRSPWRRAGSVAWGFARRVLATTSDGGFVICSHGNHVVLRHAATGVVLADMGQVKAQRSLHAAVSMCPASGGGGRDTKECVGHTTTAVAATVVWCGDGANVELRTTTVIVDAATAAGLPSHDRDAKASCAVFVPSLVPPPSVPQRGGGGRGLPPCHFITAGDDCVVALWRVSSPSMSARGGRSVVGDITAGTLDPVEASTMGPPQAIERLATLCCHTSNVLGVAVLEDNMARLGSGNTHAALCVSVGSQSQIGLFFAVCSEDTSNLASVVLATSYTTTVHARTLLSPSSPPHNLVGVRRRRDAQDHPETSVRGQVDDDHNHLAAVPRFTCVCRLDDRHFAVGSSDGSVQVFLAFIGCDVVQHNSSPEEDEASHASTSDLSSISLVRRLVTAAASPMPALAARHVPSPIFCIDHVALPVRGGGDTVTRSGTEIMLAAGRSDGLLALARVSTCSVGGSVLIGSSDLEVYCLDDDEADGSHRADAAFPVATCCTSNEGGSAGVGGFIQQKGRLGPAITAVRWMDVDSHPSASAVAQSQWIWIGDDAGRVRLVRIDASFNRPLPSTFLTTATSATPIRTLITIGQVNRPVVVCPPVPLPVEASGRLVVVSEGSVMRMLRVPMAVAADGDAARWRVTSPITLTLSSDAVVVVVDPGCVACAAIHTHALASSGTITRCRSVILVSGSGLQAFSLDD